MRSEWSGKRAVTTLLICGIAFYLCYVLRAQALIIFASTMFAVIFSPVVGWVRRLKIGRWSPSKGAAILILLAVLLGLIAVVIAFAAPKIASDMSGLS